VVLALAGQKQISLPTSSRARLVTIVGVQTQHYRLQQEFATAATYRNAIVKTEYWEDRISRPQ
jgi:hypothetical protein